MCAESSFGPLTKVESFKMDLPKINTARSAYADAIPPSPRARLSLLGAEFQTFKSKLTQLTGVWREAAFTLGCARNFYFVRDWSNTVQRRMDHSPRRLSQVFFSFTKTLVCY